MSVLPTSRKFPQYTMKPSPHCGGKTEKLLLVPLACAPRSPYNKGTEVITPENKAIHENWYSL